MSAGVTNYPQDFQPVEPPPLEPADGLLLLGVHPLILLLLTALAIGLMLLAWRAGKASAAAQPDAAESIWRAVDRACQAAMVANSDALPGAAKALRVAVDDCLGAVVALADGPAKPVKAMDQALKGRIQETVKAKDETAPHPDHKPEHGHGHSAIPANVTVVSNSHVVIKGERADASPHRPSEGAHGADHGVQLLEKPAPAPPPPAPAPAPKPAEKEVERDMTKPEQLAALREAVAQFNDHWCRREERIRELRAAHRQLSTPRPGGGSTLGHGAGVRH